MSRLEALFRAEAAVAQINVDSVSACVQAFDHEDAAEAHYACSAVAMALAQPARLLQCLNVTGATALVEKG
jgi:hypothetical protein